MAEIVSNRPQELHWYHAGPMLFGDLDTSRLYVLGLAFYFSHHASFIHIFCVNIILMLVGACYLIICRKYPDGGGVYSSAKHSSRSLAVIGGLVLCADYTVTASMSCLDAFRYLGIGGELWGVRIDLICTLLAIGLIGGINWFGPRVLFEVVVLNLVLTAAMNALPDSKLIDLGKSLMMPSI